MKAFLLSILLTFSNIVGVNINTHLSPSAQPTPTSIIIETPSPTVLVATDTPSPTRKPILPTPLPRPSSTINESVLRQFFNQTEKASIERILNDPNQLHEYEKYFYEKFKKYPIPKIAIANKNQIIAMPSKNGIVFCTGEQISKLYSEIIPMEKDAAYRLMDFDCHYNSSKKETSECQEWRRVNDQNRVAPTGGEYSAVKTMFDRYQIEVSAYDKLIEKHCSK